MAVSATASLGARASPERSAPRRARGSAAATSSLRSARALPNPARCGFAAHPGARRVTPLVSAISKQRQLSASALAWPGAGAGAAPSQHRTLHSPACCCLSLPAAPSLPPHAPALRPSGSNAADCALPLAPSPRPAIAEALAGPPKAPQRPSCARPSLDHAHHSPHALRPHHPSL